MMLILLQLVLLARNTFLEAVRQRFFHFMVLLAVGLIGSTQLFRHFNFGLSELKFIFDFGHGGIWLFGSILAVVASVQLLFSEFDQRTAITLLAKPLHRGVFLFGKFLGVALVLSVYMFIMSALLAAVLYLREQVLLADAGSSGETQEMVRYGGLLLYALVQSLRLYLVAALTFLIVCVSRTFLYAMIVSFLAMMIAQLEYIARDQVSGAEGGMLAVLLKVVSWLFPNMQLFNIGDTLVLGMGEPLGMGLFFSLVGYGLLYTFLYLGVAVWVFRQREL